MVIHLHITYLLTYNVDTRDPIGSKNIVYSWAEPFGPFLWVIGGQFDIINFGWNRCILTDLWLLNNRQICLVLATSHGPAPRFSRLCSLTAATVCHLTPGRWWSALSLLLLTGHPTLKVSIRHFMKQNVLIATSLCWKLLLAQYHKHLIGPSPTGGLTSKARILKTVSQWRYLWTSTLL